MNRMALCLSACVLFLAVWLAAGWLSAAEPSPACRALASQFATAPATLDAQALVRLGTCVTTELAARAGAVAAPSAAEPGASSPEAPTPEGNPSALVPPNVFPSPPVPSPVMPSPVIPPPEEAGQVAPSRQTTQGPSEPASALAQGSPPPASPGTAPATSGEAAPGLPARSFGQWPPPAPWGSNWPGEGVWSRP
jgi:hypothetical protein